MGDRGELRGKGIELGTGGEGDGRCGGNGGLFSGLGCRKSSSGMNGGWISRLCGWESSGLFSGL